MKSFVPISKWKQHVARSPICFQIEGKMALRKNFACGNSQSELKTTWNDAVRNEVLLGKITGQATKAGQRLKSEWQVCHPISMNLWMLCIKYLSILDILWFWTILIVEYERSINSRWNEKHVKIPPNKPRWRSTISKTLHAPELNNIHFNEKLKLYRQL